jgi:hypothetical protein
MPSTIRTFLNRPAVAQVDGAEFAANTRPIAAINITLNQGQALLVDGLLGHIRLQNPAEAVTPFPRWILAGLESDSFQEIGVAGSIFTKRDFGKLTYYRDEWLITASLRIYEIFDEPLELTGFQFYSFGLGFSAGGGAVSGYDLGLEVMGRIVNQADRKFPLEYR